MIERAGSGNHPRTWKMGDLELVLPRVPAAAEGEIAVSAAGRARALVLDHFDFLWRLLCRLGVPYLDVDDAAQQVFIVATQRLGDVPLGGERTFLYGTALRTAATIRRNLLRRARWDEPGPADCASSDPTPSFLAAR